jgi:antirestriction protein ArdC
MTTNSIERKGNDIFSQITEQIIKILEEHKKTGYTYPWIKLSCNEMPHNPHTKRVYKGFNPFILSFIARMEGYSLNRWLTFNQVKELGGSIIKGSKAAPIFFSDFQFFEKATGNKVSKEEAYKYRYEERLKLFEARPFFVRYFVFNVNQTKGLGEAFYKNVQSEMLTEPELIDKAEEIIMNTGAEIAHIEGNSAYYSPLDDMICLPALKQFPDADGYYEIIFHELAHWTGHPKRLDRKDIFNDHKKDYAFEELIAEMSSAYTLGTLGIVKMISNNAEYVRNWLQYLQNDKTFIIKAGSRAEKATNYILKPVKITEYAEEIQK